VYPQFGSALRTGRLWASIRSTVRTPFQVCLCILICAWTAVSLNHWKYNNSRKFMFPQLIWYLLACKIVVYDLIGGNSRFAFLPKSWAPVSAERKVLPWTLSQESLFWLVVMSQASSVPMVISEGLQNSVPWSHPSIPSRSQRPKIKIFYE